MSTAKPPYNVRFHTSPYALSVKSRLLDHSQNSSDRCSNVLNRES
jgi:hypothetical protein